MKRKIKEFALVMMIACTFFGNPEVLGWWNLIYPAELTEDAGKAKETELKGRKVRFFILEWLSSLK